MVDPRSRVVLGLNCVCLARSKLQLQPSRNLAEKESIGASSGLVCTVCSSMYDIEAKSFYHKIGMSGLRPTCRARWYFADGAALTIGSLLGSALLGSSGCPWCVRLLSALVAPKDDPAAAHWMGLAALVAQQIKARLPLPSPLCPSSALSAVSKKGT